MLYGSAAFFQPVLESATYSENDRMQHLLHSRWILLRLACLFLLWTPCAVAAQQGLWPMKGYDGRRTGQSPVNGPRALDPAQSWTVELPGAHTINIGATVTEDGVFFGSWGLLRRDPENPGDPRFWDKSDGQFYGLDLETGASLWGAPLDLDLVHRCYAYADRGPNVIWCGITPYEVSFYNGTVEGQAAYDAGRNVLYVGRGDGKLFAIAPDAGRILWRYVTFNPQLPDDPDGGGEVVSAPLVGPDGTIYLGTWGEGPYETNAIYAINPDGTLQWRYPSETSLSHRVFAAPAFSPDASTIYVSTFRDDDGDQPATLYAFHREPLESVPDAQRLKWALPLEHEGTAVHTTTLAVGSDGKIYVAGYLAEGFGVPVVAAVEEREGQPVLAWPTPYVRLQDGAHFAHGVALRETDGQTRRLYVTTSNLRTFNRKVEGTLYAIDSVTGAVLASYDPSDDVPEAVGGITSPAIGADGVVYFGVRGRFGSDPIPGRYFGVTYDAQAARFERLWSTAVNGVVEWNHPSIGPDGGLYAGSSSFDEQARTRTYDEGTIPEGTTAWFHALKGPTSTVSTDQAPAARPFRLNAPYPHPFSSHTTLAVEMMQASIVQVSVFDGLGRRVHVLHDGPLPAGRHVFRWDGAGARVPSGAYFVRMQVGGLVQVQPVVRVR